jgi:hypothetical protein
VNVSQLKLRSEKFDDDDDDNNNNNNNNNNFFEESGHYCISRTHCWVTQQWHSYSAATGIE